MGRVGKDGEQYYKEAPQDSVGKKERNMSR